MYKGEQVAKRSLALVNLNNRKLSMSCLGVVRDMLIDSYYLTKLHISRNLVNRVCFVFGTSDRETADSPP